MVVVVVAAHVNHDGVVAEFLDRLDLGRQDGLRGRAVLGDVEGREVALVTVVGPGEGVRAGVLRIPVTAFMPRPFSVGPQSGFTCTWKP